ncbi:uncharacterized protein LOC116349545 [Contarinia nasturtii]|uniref:uncharacterized protein LOC116349545 n=1 Tax=Contarinia nasturtii TaxID=265458 RepID=UPI0012D3C270|nr:uncharacterized protein LOC116349545 [Contarinia nasturtii]
MKTFSFLTFVSFLISSQICVEAATYADLLNTLHQKAGVDMGLSPIFELFNETSNVPTLVRLLQNVERNNNKLSTLHNPTNDAYLGSLIFQRGLIAGFCQIIGGFIPSFISVNLDAPTQDIYNQWKRPSVLLNMEHMQTIINNYNHMKQTQETYAQLIVNEMLALGNVRKTFKENTDTIATWFPALSTNDLSKNSVKTIMNNYAVIQQTVNTHLTNVNTYLIDFWSKRDNWARFIMGKDIDWNEN